MDIFWMIPDKKPWKKDLKKRGNRDDNRPKKIKHKNRKINKFFSIVKAT